MKPYRDSIHSKVSLWEGVIVCQWGGVGGDIDDVFPVSIIAILFRNFQYSGNQEIPYTHYIYSGQEQSLHMRL